VSWCQAGQRTPAIRGSSGTDLVPLLLQVVSGLKEVRDRIASVKNTMKITEAMKLVAAAKVRRAQEAVVNGRPFTENLIKVSSRLLHAWPAAHSEPQQRQQQ
jgi:ATP synthase F1 gamma subunit